MDPCLSSRYTMKDAEFAECAPGMPDALCNTDEQAKNFQGYVAADDMAAADIRDSIGTVDYTHKDSAGASVDTLVGTLCSPWRPTVPKTMRKKLRRRRLRSLFLRIWQ